MPSEWIARHDQTLALQGEWTLANYRDIKSALSHYTVKTPARNEAGAESVSLKAITRLDTAGAVLVIELIGVERAQKVSDWAGELPTEQQALLVRIAEAMETPLDIEPPSYSRLSQALATVGGHMVGLWSQQRQLLAFIGLVIATLFQLIFRPRRWRVTATVAHVQQSGLNAVPIVALLTFMVGAVVAFLGATVLQDFGATVYTIDLVAFSFLREFGVLLAAILLAGRTASAFTAQIGAMKSNEEIDALQAQGLDPIELLVLPRVMAMLVSLPMLAFVGMLSGLAGGAMVAALSLDISLTQFINTLQKDVSVTHFLVGLSKAPVFAFVIAVIGCLEGFKVSGSAQSVGAHTTSSVVQSIFMVILIDALAALFFMEMGW
ncbi:MULTISPECIES: MlaE family ABC transporter permease [unclassified Halomonas]|uniref:MlaE family ABC transporter permease n=1 Tax=unclassified Halomonas TaxID=2609666 RepID=UPI001CF59862|nr:MULTISPECIES: ABC transporter permease [unclassified Halomonas]MCA8866713.1 ABC transporter permease [Halomonas sp. SBBP1]UZH08049.1 ABC transporter permease [Halomonas sp. BDJS001]